MKKYFIGFVAVMALLLVFPSDSFADDGSSLEIQNLYGTGNYGGAPKATSIVKQFGCGLNQMTLEGNQDPDDDEFLYDSLEAFNSAPKNNGTYAVQGMVWECDNEFCGHNEEKQMKAGHVFEGKVIDSPVKYRCKTGGFRQSHWEPIVADAICGETTVSFDGNQKPADNEFLYENAMAWNSVQGRPDGATVAGGRVYECDDEHCHNGQTVDLAAGHYFNGVMINEAASYRCSSGFWNGQGIDDLWIRMNNGCRFGGRDIPVGWYTDANGTRMQLTYAECSQVDDMNPADINKLFNLECLDGGQMRCVPVDGGSSDEGGGAHSVCPSGSSNTIRSQENCAANQVFKCVENAATGECICGRCDDKAAETPVPPVKPNPVPQNCKQKRATDEGKACCDVEPVGAKWENNQCVCPNGMKFEMDAKTKAGRCMPVAGASFDCPASVTAILAEYRVKCALKPAIMAVIKEIDDLCKSSTRTAERYNALMATLTALHPENCASEVAEAVIEHSTTQVERRITDATAQLESMADGLKVTVWKNEEGKFNTARLASDSIAGVVLGTTGALVTSSVVKKNQVENGFEDIQCTVGGQVVASWGDEFRVGIQ